MDAVGAFQLLLVTIVGLSLALLCRSRFARLTLVLTTAIVDAGLVLAAAWPVWPNLTGFGGVRLMIAAWLTTAVAGLMLALLLWLTGRRRHRSALPFTLAALALASLIAGVIVPPSLYVAVEVRSGLELPALRSTIDGAVAVVIGRPPPDAIRVFGCRRGRVAVLVTYDGPQPASYYLRLSRHDGAWRVDHWLPVNSDSQAITGNFTVPPY